jgi:hypothetical protein
MTWISRLFPWGALEAKEAELVRAEKHRDALMSEIRNLTDKLSAQIDVKSHEAYVRGEQWRNGEPRERKPPAVRIPPYGQHSISKRHINLGKTRQIVKTGDRDDLPPVAEDPVAGA